jgi:acetoin utilization protein AcuC
MQGPPPPPTPAYIYTDQYQAFDYGPGHPLRISRLALTHELIRACGLLEGRWFTVRPASDQELAAYHDRRYLQVLQELSQGEGVVDYWAFGLGAGDNPVFPGVYDWAALVAGATLLAVDLVALMGHSVAFNMAGGMHHALAARASGFCYVNDPVLAIKALVGQGFRVAYVDIDAHHADGVQWAFYEDPRVLTISIHQHPATLFPGTGVVEEMGRGEGLGYAVNVPLWPDADDEVFTACFDAVVPPLLEAFGPDFVVTQLGVDSFWRDPLASLNLTTRGFEHALVRLRELCRERWIALGGGGYDVLNVARAWTLAWAVMRGQEDELPERLPPEMCRRLGLKGERTLLRDPPERLRGRGWDRARREAKETVAYIQRQIFPLLGARA